MKNLNFMTFKVNHYIQTHQNQLGSLLIMDWMKIIYGLFKKHFTIKLKLRIHTCLEDSEEQQQ